MPQDQQNASWRQIILYNNLMNLKIQVFLNGVVSFRISRHWRNVVPSNSGCSSSRRTALHKDRVYYTGVGGGTMEVVVNCTGQCLGVTDGTSVWLSYALCFLYPHRFNTPCLLTLLFFLDGWTLMLNTLHSFKSQQILSPNDSTWIFNTTVKNSNLAEHWLCNIDKMG